MKKFATRSIAVVAMVATVGVGIPAEAFASSSTSSSGTTLAVSTPWTTWRATWVTYIKGLESINATYRHSMRDARWTYRHALKGATSTERQAAFAAYEVSITAALNARVTAITAAGDPPSPPAGYNGTAYVTGFQAANEAFRASVASAQATLSLALVGATAQQARTARLTYEQALGAAIVVHSTALLALGNPPTDPGQPSA
jgi:hypothetical protein